LGTAALATLGAVALLGQRGPELTGHVSFDDGGKPRLELRCGACVDGTLARLGAESATFAAGRATLGLGPVRLGPVRWPIALESPSGKRIERELALTVDWIVSADMRGLSQPSPKLTLVVDADPALGVIVDGKTLPPTASGPRRHEIDIREDVTGTSASISRVSRRVPYLITGTDGTSTRGELELAADVVPLMVEAPGESLVIEEGSFLLAGTTQSDGSVTVEGRPITVDPTGRFAQRMSVSAIGETSVTVRASAPGRAPRLFPVRVKRVSSLAREAESFARGATKAYTALGEGLEQKRGWAVALTGTVLDVKSDAYSSELSMNVSSGCSTPPCPLLARWGVRSAVAAGEKVTVYGHLTGEAVKGESGRPQPVVRVEFLRGAP
jgi:hypothetical protein